MPERTVVFDVMGTVFDLSSLGRRLEALGAPGAALQAWFGRALHHAAALTLTDHFEPFQKILDKSLRSTLAQLDLEPDGAADVLAGLSELDAYPEANEATARAPWGCRPSGSHVSNASGPSRFPRHEASPTSSRPRAR